MKKGTKLVLFIGIINLLLSLMFVKENFEMFLFFFIIFAICFIYSRSLVFEIISKPIIKEIDDLNNNKLKLQKEVVELQKQYKEISNYLSNNKDTINLINSYKENINKMTMVKEQLNTEIMKLEEKKKNIEQIVKQEELVNRAIRGEERTFNILSEENNRLKSKNKYLNNEVKKLSEQFMNIKEQSEFVNKYNLDIIDKLDGFEFERFCVEMLKINGYENVRNTQKSIDYGIDIIAEKNNIKYAIQCKRYDGKVGNDAIQEAMTGKEYYECNIAIVLTNSIFTQNAQKLAKSTGVILWDRSILQDILNKEKDKIF